MLRVAIVHYHLKRGGVTRVMESTLRGLSDLPEPVNCVVLAGEMSAEVSFREQAVEVDGLHYSNAQADTPDAATLLASLKQAAVANLGAEPDVWHIHNHSLGKNSSMPELVALLAEEGAAVLLQMHDFAEDGRPENYKLIPSAQRLYPNCPRVHYAVINARDYAFIQDMGVEASRLHLLANPVEGETPHPQAIPSDNAIRSTLGAERLILYPVRAVRRKNFGELLLWSALAEDGDVFATTLGPTNKNYTAAYEHWKSFAASYDLPVRFAIGESHDWSFDSIMEAATAILSTSIVEGFGLAFLEPWLFGKAIVGRDLPQITADFKAVGLDLTSLYTAVGIPPAWIDLDALRSAIEVELEKAYATYQIALPQDATERALAAITLPDGRIDFGGLDERLQEDIIARLVRDPAARNELLETLELGPADPQHIQANADIIRQHYGLSHYASQLHGIYQDIGNASTDTVCFFNGTDLLNAFLKPENFRLLRT